MPRNYSKLWEKYPTKGQKNLYDQSDYKRISFYRFLGMAGILLLVFVLFVAVGIGTWMLLNLLFP